VITLLLWSLLNAFTVKVISSTESLQGNIINNCEINILALHNANISAKHDELIILIARLGKSEKSRSLNLRRLHNVKTYLTKFLGRDSKSIVTAEGSPDSGYGCVEIYVAGKLADKIEVEPGGDLRVGSCDNTSPADKLFYNSDSKKMRRQ
jgi:hypothetical protein